MRINLPKFHFAKTDTEWLGYKFTQSRIAHLETKTSLILNLTAPKTSKQLRSFLGSVHYWGKFILNLSQLCHPLQPLHKKNTKFISHNELETHFQHKDKVANATENTHFNPHLESRIKFDANSAGFGAALEQQSPTGWHTVVFASRFVNSNEKRSSGNELELLDLVRSVEYFKYYLFGKSFTIIIDHRVLLSIMKEHRSYKSYNSRLTCWVDRLLAFGFNIDHTPGAKMGPVDYISRQSNQKVKAANKYDEEFVVATITRIRDAIAANYINTKPLYCQSQHFNSVNHTHSTRASIAQQTNHSNLLSALNLRTNQLYLSHSANAAQIQTFNNSSMRTSNTFHQTPPAPTASGVTFQSTPNAAVNSSRSSNECPVSLNLELSKEEVFENNLTQLFTKGFLAVLTSKDAVLKEKRKCILQGDEQRCKDVFPYLHFYWRPARSLGVCLC